jgi:beta-galactosidase
MDIEDSGDRIVITGKDFRLGFSRTAGSIDSLEYGQNAVFVKGEEGICGPDLNVFRAPTDNDKYLSREWDKAGLRDLKKQVKEFRLDSKGKNMARISILSLYRGAGDLGFNTTSIYTVFSNGVILVENKIDPFGQLPVLPKMGLKMTVSGDFDFFHWFGRGPHENYPDRKESADVGRYAASVAGQYIPYARPQETGNKEEVRWAALTDDAGTGLLVVAEGDLLAVSTLYFTASDLDRADHINEIFPREEVYLNLDHKQCGLGNASCGPGVLDKYALKPEPTRFSFSFRPYFPTMGDIASVARTRLPKRPEK